MRLRWTTLRRQELGNQILLPGRELCLLGHLIKDLGPFLSGFRLGPRKCVAASTIVCKCSPSSVERRKRRRWEVVFRPCEVLSVRMRQAGAPQRQERKQTEEAFQTPDAEFLHEIGTLS